MRRFQFHPEALEEADHAASFYSSKQAGLDRRFLETLEDTIARIRRNPTLYRKVDEGIRKCRLPRFPYAVIFRDTSDSIEIIAVMHLKRQPGYWESRT